MRRMKILAIVISFAAMTAQADTMVNVTSQAGQGATDTALWSQLGADQKLLTASFAATSSGGLGVTVSLAGPNSIVSVDCVATPCSWEGGSALSAGDSLIWTSDNGNSGNGPITFTFAQGVSGAGAFVQANAPGQFTVQIQAFNGATLLGTFSEASDASGDAMYIGLQDATGANITSVTISLTACGPQDSSRCTDFAVDTLNLNDSVTKQASTTGVTSSLNPSTFGQLVTFTATVTPATSGTPTGSVTFKNGATTLATKTLSGGAALYATSALAPGSLSITAVYGGDSNFTGSTSAVLTQVVNKIATTTSALTSSLNPSTYGQAVTYSASVISATGVIPNGSVTFKDGTTTLGSVGLNSSGVANFTTTKTSAGTRSITGFFGGSTDYAASTSPVFAQVVSQAATTTSAPTSSLNPSTYGQAVTYSASVISATGAVPGGSVTFKDGTTTLGSVGLNSSGVANFTTTKTPAGSGSITAVYTGTVNFAGSTSPALAQTVNQVTTTTSAITSSLNPSTFGQVVTYSASVTSATSVVPVGTVTFKNGSATLGTASVNASGIAAFTTKTTVAGTDTISATYAGNSNFIGSAAPAALTQTVNQAATTTSAITSSLNPSTYGQSVTYSVTVTSATSVTPSGAVVFKNGTTTLGSVGLNSSGVANFSTTTTPAGTGSITAFYMGNVDFIASTSPAFTQMVNQAGTTTAVTSSLNPSTFGTSVTFTATVTPATPGTPAGTVTFMDGATTLGTRSLTSGKATLAISTLASGSHAITVVYGGSSNFTGSTSPLLTQTVN
ncbi:MAG TPA: Ig-like domain-containing protein [Candidatus Acidoferrales bacterium]|nr:Ig-like domain-containing protein [Candidatus Acidoferrales bacterium]